MSAQFASNVCGQQWALGNAACSQNSCRSLRNGWYRRSNITLKFKAAWEANEAFNRGDYLTAANDTVMIFLELFVETFGSPALAYPLDIAKIATAFATAYTYGFFWGQ